ncbi:undecaprenyl-diphosphate phosphatase [Quadrisphaera sp. GCM10027208]|uniref:undecaprenyl-diphosphate phosphatase n=1 Tax=Quadrisphaera sp. GCM10027208 TaxID=3273423 RepID=UPI00360F2B63|nr:undecaprenyl-diphosphate phosphatase [Kineosporiaceae bacterium SCSIO 59966]
MTGAPDPLGWFEALVLGVVQGLTEFLPISSSAHLRIVGDLMGTGDPGAAFTAISQLGTETAVVIYFWRDIVRIVRQWSLALAGRVPRDDPDARMGWLVIIGSVPIVVLGLVLEDMIEGTFRNLWIVATTLWAFALVLGWADRTARSRRTLDQLTWRHGIIFGFAQAMALIPGVSRSGGTITAGLLMGYTREAAARYSFLLAIPAVMGSGFYQLATAGEQSQPVVPTVIATVVAFVVGYAVIAWFMRFISTRSFQPFVVYRVLLGLGVYGLLAAGVLSPL